MYRFEIHKATNCITVYFIGEDHSRFMITSLEEMLMMIPNEIEQKRYRNIVGNAEWLLLNGIHDYRGMTEKEITAFFYYQKMPFALTSSDTHLLIPKQYVKI